MDSRTSSAVLDAPAACSMPRSPRDHCGPRRFGPLASLACICSRLRCQTLPMAPSTRSQSSLAPPTRSSATPSSELAASSSSSGGPQTRARSRQRTSDESDKTVVPAGPSRRASPDGGVDYDDSPSSEFAASLASYTPPHSEPARDLAERAVVQSLLATWCNWAVESDADPERRFLRTASHVC